MVLLWGEERMRFTIPDYYREFTCIAGECPDTCCAGWQIMIDGKSLKKYRRVKGNFRNRLLNGIDWRQGAFCQHEKRCEFLNEENLCDIYREVGRRMLCDTCRKYPRHVEEFEGLREVSLSLSCPETARILLEKKEKVKFLHGEKRGAEENYETFDYLLFSALMDARDYLIQVIQNREVPMKLRVQKILVYAHDLQICYERGVLYQAEEIRRRHEKSGFQSAFQGKVENRIKDVDCACELLQQMWKTIVPGMEVLREEWPIFLKEHLSLLYEDGKKSYQKKQADFRNIYEGWETEIEQLLVYWIFTYFCGAVYDGEIFAKVKLAVVSTLLIHELDVGRFVRKNQSFELRDQIMICYWYSRELEHSDQNLNRMESILTENPGVGLEKLLKAADSLL